MVASESESFFSLFVKRMGARQRRFRYHLLELTTVRFTIALFKEIEHDDVSNMAASISYFAILALFPLILALIAILGIILPYESVQRELMNFLAQYIPGSVGFLQDNLNDIIRFRGALGAIGILGLLWSGTGVFSSISRGVNRAFDIEFRHPFYISKPKEIVMVLCTGVLFVLSLGASTLFSRLGSLNLPITGALANIGTIALGFVFSLVIFSFIYKSMPITWVSWRNIWPGALLSAVLFEIAKTFFVFYLNHFNNYDKIYGSIASVIALLVWIYYSAYILLLGAEFSSMLYRLRTEGEVLNGPSDKKDLVKEF